MGIKWTVSFRQIDTMVQKTILKWFSYQKFKKTKSAIFPLYFWVNSFVNENIKLAIGFKSKWALFCIFFIVFVNYNRIYMSGIEIQKFLIFNPPYCLRVHVKYHGIFFILTEITNNAITGSNHSRTNCWCFFSFILIWIVCAVDEILLHFLCLLIWMASISGR